MSIPESTFQQKMVPIEDDLLNWATEARTLAGALYGHLEAMEAALTLQKSREALNNPTKK